MEFKFSGWVSGLLERLEPKPQPEIRLKLLGTAPSSPYRAVSVRPGPVSCQAAKQFGSMRFFPHKAPRFPLPECTCENCTCSYVHHADRRAGFDRRKVLAREQVAARVDRRVSPGRRSTDSNAFDDPHTSILR